LTEILYPLVARADLIQVISERFRPFWVPEAVPVDFVDGCSVIGQLLMYASPIEFHLFFARFQLSYSA
jgi:hypothetical protein